MPDRFSGKKERGSRDAVAATMYACGVTMYCRGAAIIEEEIRRGRISERIFEIFLHFSEIIRFFYEDVKPFAFGFRHY